MIFTKLIIYRMENTKLNLAISSYCKENNLQKTFKALNLKADDIDNHKKATDGSVAKMFEKYLKNIIGRL